MRALLVTALLVSTALASPAAARDQSWYGGLEGGVLFIDEMSYDYEDEDFDIDNAFEIDRSRGFDVDLIAGYDFGMFRAELELAYKRGKTDGVGVSDDIDGEGADYDAEGRATAFSGMINGLVDFGFGNASAYVGAGLGVARVKERLRAPELGVDFTGYDRGIAWQGIAGVRVPVSATTDVGLKYRYFNVPEVEFGAETADGPFFAEGSWRSHSLLASLIFNMAPPPPPPPVVAPVAVVPAPAVEAPATQTCPDGTVILATDLCPAPPPPPPPATGERG